MKSPARRVVVLRLGSAGDVLLTSPALEALRRAWPDSEIVFAVKAAFAPLVRHNPHLSRIEPLQPGEGARAFAARLAPDGCDAVLDLHRTTRTRWLRTWLPGRHVVWSKRPWADNLPVRLGLRPYRARMTIAARYHAAVEQLVGRAVEPGKLRYFLGEEDQRDAERALGEAGLPPTARLVGMSVGAMWETKRWPIERFAALATRCVERGFAVVLTGSKGEHALAEELRRSVPAAHNLSGATGLAGLAGLIARCTAFVANDSGPMHLARALGVPTLTFFGSTDPRQFEFAGHHAMFAGLPCSPCHFYGRPRCPKGHFGCMRQLEVDRAWGELERLLAAGRQPFVGG